MLRIKSVWSIQTFAVHKHLQVQGGRGPTPPPRLHIRMDIQTDGDYTKRVVTPFGTTRLNIGCKILFEVVKRSGLVNLEGSVVALAG